MQRGELTPDLGVNVGASAAAPDEEIESMQDKLGVLHYVRACACVSLNITQTLEERRMGRPQQV